MLRQGVVEDAYRVNDQTHACTSQLRVYCISGPDALLHIFEGNDSEWWPDPRLFRSNPYQCSRLL